MAFQGKKRILYYIIQITSVLPLMKIQTNLVDVTLQGIHQIFQNCYKVKTHLRIVIAFSIYTNGCCDEIFSQEIRLSRRPCNME